MEVITPEGEINISNVPERYMLMNHNYKLQIYMKNKNKASNTPIDFYLKYRTNGFKITRIPDNLKSGVRFSMNANQDFSFEIEIMPTTEGPLQLDVQFIGIKKDVMEKSVDYNVEVDQEIEFEIEKEVEVPISEIMENLPKTCENCQHFQKISKYCIRFNQMKNPQDTSDEFLMISQDQIQPRTRIVKRIEKRIEKKIEKRTRIDHEIVESEVLVDSQMAYMEAINSGDSQNLETIITDGDISTNINEINLNIVFFHFPKLDLVRNKDLLRQVNKYTDLSLGITFLYINYPITMFSEKEKGIIKEAITKFLPKLSTNKPVIVFNLEFLPKLGRPSVILGKDDSVNEIQEIYSLIRSRLTEDFLVQLDENVFSGGNILETVKEFCTPFNVKVINLALSGEFEETIDYFIHFMKVFN